MTILHVVLRPSFIGSGTGNGARRRRSSEDLWGAEPSGDDAMRLADRILALDEPWRSRFVDLIASQVGEQVPREKAAWRCALLRWLTHHQIYEVIAAMVRTWTHEAL